MMQLLTAFAAFSMAGTVILSLLPDSGIKRTAGMIIGLLTLSSWVQGVIGLFGFTLPDVPAVSPLVPTPVSLTAAVEEASSSLAKHWENMP